MTERHPGPTVSRVVRATREATISARAGQRRFTPYRLCPVPRDNGCPQPGPPGLRVAIRVLEHLARPVASSFGGRSPPVAFVANHPPRERSGWAGKSVALGRARASRRLAEVDGRRSDHECSSAVAAAEAHLDLARTGGSSRASERRRGACTGWCTRRALWRFRRPKALRALRTPGPFTRVRAEASTGSHASRPSQDPSLRELPERQRPPLRTVPAENAGTFPETSG